MAAGLAGAGLAGRTAAGMSGAPGRELLSRPRAPGRAAVRDSIAAAAKIEAAGSLTAPSQITVPEAAWIPGASEGPSRAARAATAARSLRGPRMPFVLLVLSLLGGGLICLLVINTTLGASQFRITKLQQIIVRQSEQQQALQQQVANEQAPGWLEPRALRLGMRTQTVLKFLDLRTGRVYSQPATVPGVIAYPQGYTP